MHKNRQFASLHVSVFQRGVDHRPASVLAPFPSHRIQNGSHDKHKVRIEPQHHGWMFDNYCNPECHNNRPCFALIRQTGTESQHSWSFLRNWQSNVPYPCDASKIRNFYAPAVPRKQPSVLRTHPPIEERVAALMEIAQEPASNSLPMKSSLPNATFRRLIDLESEENFDTISSAGFGNSTRIEIIKQLNLTVGSVSDECVQGEAASR